MNRLLLIVLFLLSANKIFAQKDKDTTVYNLPEVNGKLVYKDSIFVKGRSDVMLDSLAKKWFNGYFKYWQSDTLSKDRVKNCSVLAQGVLEYTARPGLLNIPYFAIISIMIKCNDDGYVYEIHDILFRPQNGILYRIGYERDPEYLINLYKQKHIGLIKAMSIDRGMIRNYLSSMNTAVLNCIASLKKAMTN